MNTNLSTAPRDRNILILTKVELYRHGKWEFTGQRWTEAFYDHEESEFVQFCGDHITRTTEDLFPIAWALLPNDAELVAANSIESKLAPFLP